MSGHSLYSTDLLTLSFLFFEGCLKHSYFWLKLWLGRFGFALGRKVSLILAEKILRECVVSFILLVMKYSCVMNKLSMPLSHFNLVILNEIWIFELFGWCWIKKLLGSLLSATAALLGHLAVKPCRLSWASLELLGLQGAVLCQDLEWSEWKFPLVCQNLTYELGHVPAWSLQMGRAIHLT